MRIARNGLRPAFGFLVIAHGLAHIVLASRGWMEPSRLAKDFTPFLLYAIAVLGFTIAGLGVFDVRPFKWMTRPAMVLASAYSLIAIFLFNQPDLAWGGAVSLALLITGLTGLYRRLPARSPLGAGVWHDMGVGAAITLVLIAAVGVVVWPLGR
jgi:uncharacterized BrkB/YihY/UPF0761 family membrane protein